MNCRYFRVQPKPRLQLGLFSLVFFRSFLLVCAISDPSCAAPQTAPGASAFDDLARAAAAARNAERLGEAAALYGKALAIKPRWTEGWWSLGTLEYDQDHYAKAAQAFTKLLALDPKNGTAHAMLGLCQFELGKDAFALKNLLAAESLGIVKEEQLRRVALYHLAVLQLRGGHYGAARESLGQLVRDHIVTKEITTGLGIAALLIRPKDAPADGTPGSVVVEKVGQCEVLLFSNQFEPAKQIYARLTSDFPDYPNLHFAYGRFLLETHETDAAVQEFQLELKHDPKNVNSMLEIAMGLQLVDPEAGVKFAEDAARLAPHLPLAHYLVGTLRLNSGNPQGAIPELEIAERAFPDESGVYYALGTAYSRVGRKTDATKARAEFRRLAAKVPKPSGAVIYSDRPTSVLSGQGPQVDREQPPR